MQPPPPSPPPKVACGCRSSRRGAGGGSMYVCKRQCAWWRWCLSGGYSSLAAPRSSTLPSSPLGIPACLERACVYGLAIDFPWCEVEPYTSVVVGAPERWLPWCRMAAAMALELEGCVELVFSRPRLEGEGCRPGPFAQHCRHLRMHGACSHVHRCGGAGPGRSQP